MKRKDDGEITVNRIDQNIKCSECWDSGRTDVKANIWQKQYTEEGGKYIPLCSNHGEVNSYETKR